MPKYNDVKWWLKLAGFLISGILLFSLLKNLDWSTFIGELNKIDLGLLSVATLMVLCGVLIRSSRWNLLANISVRKFCHFWRAASLGYLGNYIYPARAGEVIRVAVLNRSTRLAIVQVATSALIDRLCDIVMLGSFILVLVIIHCTYLFNPKGILGIIAIALLPVFGLIIFAARGDRWESRINDRLRYLPFMLRQRIMDWYSQTLVGIHSLRDPRRIFSVVVLNGIVFVMDFGAIWMILHAFGWSLPFWAAVTVGVFIATATSLPSTPGYVRIPVKSISESG
jgi:uncharacterized protein (TIRG00374 family)